MDQNSKEKKLFFFGQPGCLKVKFDIPIRPSENSDSQSDDNDIGEKHNSEGISENTLIDDKNTIKKAESTSSDDDGVELLKKIDAALEVKNEHQSEDNSGNLSNETIKEATPINDASNNHVDETIQKESNSIEKQSDETSTNEESQEISEEKKSESALEIASSANTETIITEKIENVYNVKSVDNIESNDEHNLAVDECKPVDLISEENSSQKSLEVVDKKSEETENIELKISEKLVESNESSHNVESICESKEIIEEKMESPVSNESSLEEKSLEKEEISLKEVENVENESSSENLSIVEKSHDEKPVENIEENKEKQVYSENEASKLSNNQIETCASSVNDPVICEYDKNDIKSESNEIIATEQPASSSLLVEDSQITQEESEDITDNANIEKLPEFQEPAFSGSLKPEIIITEPNSDNSEELNELTPPQEEIKINKVPNDEHTCPSQEPQVLTAATSIKNDEESVPMNDYLEKKDDEIEIKETALEDEDKSIIPIIKEEEKATTENLESQNKVTEATSHIEVKINDSEEVSECPTETQKDESLIEVENTFIQSKEEEEEEKQTHDQTDENLSTEHEKMDETQAPFVEKETSEIKEVNMTIFKNVDTDQCPETSEASKTEDECKIMTEEQALESNPIAQNVETLISDNIMSHEEEEPKQVEEESEEIINTEEEPLSIKESISVEANIDEPCSPQIVDKSVEALNTENQISENKDEVLTISQGSPPKFDTDDSTNQEIEFESEKQIVNNEEESSNEKQIADNTEKETSSNEECTPKIQHQNEQTSNPDENTAQEKEEKLIAQQEFSTEFEESKKVDENTKDNFTEIQEQNECNSLMEPEKTEIADKMQEQDIQAHSEDDTKCVAEEKKIEEPAAMEIDEFKHDDNVETRELQIEQADLTPEITTQDSTIIKEDQDEVQPDEECESSDVQGIEELDQEKGQKEETNEVAVEINKDECRTEILEEEKTPEISNDDKIVNIENIEKIEEVNVPETQNVVEEIPKSDEVEQDLQNQNIEAQISEESKSESEDLSSDQVEKDETPAISEEESQKEESSEMYQTTDSLNADQNDKIVKEEDISVLDEQTPTPVDEEMLTQEDENIQNENESTSKENEEELVVTSKIIESQPIQENDSLKENEIITKESGEEIMQTDDLTSEIRENEDFPNKNEISLIENENDIVQMKENVETQSIQESECSQNENELEPKVSEEQTIENDPQPSSEGLKEIECSDIVENKETSQETDLKSDKPEVLNELSKESFEHEDKTETINLRTEVQSSESENLEKVLNEKDEISIASLPSDDSRGSEIDASDETELKESQDFEKSQESYIETESKDDSLNLKDPIDAESTFTEKIEIIPQKSITVEENLNEKINDNQVELSKNDNKSSSLGKVSPLEDINIQNENSNDLIKSNTALIEVKENIEEDSSVAQSNKDIQNPFDVKITENLEYQNVEEEKVELKTEKQYEQATEHHTEDNLTDNNINEKCKEDINVGTSKEIVVENLTEKIILNEMPVKEVCTDNNQDNIETHEDPKHLLEPDSKCSEIATPPAEKIAINEEVENKLETKETTEILDMTKHEDSESKDIPSEDISKISDENVSSLDQNAVVETVHVESTNEICATKSVDEIEKNSEQPPVDPFEEVNVKPQTANDFDELLDKEAKFESIPITKSFQKPASTRKRKLSERKSISESDSDGGSHFVTDSVSNEKSSDEETVATKKPRIRNKITATRNTRATRQSARVLEDTKSSPEVKPKEPKKPKTEEKKEEEEKTLQNLKFDYDENEDIAAKMAAIKTLICKDTPKKEEEGSDDNDDSNESSADESAKKKPIRKGRKGKRGRTAKKDEAHESSSDESKSAKVSESKRTKTSESEETTAEKQSRKKRDSSGKGLLKHLDTSLVIETVETEAPIRQSRRIAQQKIREETERRQMEEKMLKKMKEEAERRKKLALIPEPPDDEDDDHSSDESYKGSKRKKKKKPTDPLKPWLTSSSHSEHSDTEDEFERPPSEDPGSPLFRSDHEFSPESDDDEAPAQPVKRARTAKKQVEESSDDEDVNPNHACQVCHKTDCPEWILLCDECDHGYHCSCLKPIIFCIPSGNWYCPLCCHKKLVDDLSVQLEKLDTLIVNIKEEEIRQQKQLEIKKLTEITEENILNDRRKNRSEINAKDEQSRKHGASGGSESSDDGGSSDNSSDNAPLNEIFYKLRRRNQTTTSYRFNDYDDLINSAIRDEMEEVKGMGNAGRGKDISTIIEADKEEKKLQKIEKEKVTDDKNEKPSDHQEGEESSGSDIVRPKKAMQRKKKNRKLNNLDETSEEDQASDEDFKGTPSSNSDTEEEYSMSSNDVSESSLDLPLKKSKAGGRRTRSAAKNRRYDETFIDDHSSDDEPLIKKRIKKQIDSDEEEFDANENSDGSTPEDIDSEDLCDDTESEDSSENNWPRKKKKKVASYDIKKPRKPSKKTDDGKDKAFRAGISKKKILKQSDNESDGSENESDKGRRRTRGKKLLYLIEDDYESDDGIKPGIGVVRPETPPEERELFVKKQEEIKRMLAEKNTEAARQLAVPTIEPIKFSLEKPKSPSPPPLTSDELASLSTIPKNVIEGAKALDMDYNKIKPIHFGVHSKASDLPSAHEMSEEDLARMMEEEDFAQHQLKMVGESINRNKLLELEVKEEAFANIGKGAKIKDEKEPEKPTPSETKKRARKPKVEKQAGDLSSPTIKLLQSEAAPLKGPITQHIAQLNVPVTVPTSLPPAHELTKPPTQNIPSVPPLISNPVSHSPYANLPPRYAGPSPHPLNIQDRPSVLSNFMPRHEGMQRFEGMPPRLGGMPPRLGIMQPRLEGMLSRLEGMGPRLEGMGPRLEGMGARLEGMRPRLEGMGPRLEGMGPRLEGMRPRMEGMPPRLEGITARLEGMTARLEGGPPSQHLRFPHPPSEGFPLKASPAAPQLAPQSTNEEGEEKKKGRRKKYTPLRTDLAESNLSKVAKLETPTTSSVIHSTLNLSSERSEDKNKASLPPLQRAKTEVFNPATNPTSVITRLLQPQQRPPFGGFAEQMNVSVTSASNPNQPNPNPRAFPEEMKHLPIAKQVRPGPQAQFPENPFVPRGMHTLYRGPPTSQPSIYGIPSHHARIPYPFHLHPNNNLRPNIQEYGAPYNIPPQFGYYAPPAHSRQHPPNPAAPPLSHQEHPDLPPNNARPNNNVNPNDEPSESSEFGGLVSYFSSQQELD